MVVFVLLCGRGLSGWVRRGALCSEHTAQVARGAPIAPLSVRRVVVVRCRNTLQKEETKNDRLSLRNKQRSVLCWSEECVIAEREKKKCGAFFVGDPPCVGSVGRWREVTRPSGSEAGRCPIRVFLYKQSSGGPWPRGLGT